MNDSPSSEGGKIMALAFLIVLGGAESQVLADMDFDLEAADFAPESVPPFALAPAFV
jgi:hypothetical protein